jgi:hypothetical protein
MYSLHYQGQSVNQASINNSLYLLFDSEDGSSKIIQNTGYVAKDPRREYY